MTDKRTERVTFRLTEAELKGLHSAAASAHMSESEYIRVLLSGNAVQIIQLPIDGARLDEIRHELKKCGTNINQISYRFNIGDAVAVDEFNNTMRAHRAALQHLTDFIDETRPK